MAGGLQPPSVCAGEYEIRNDTFVYALAADGSFQKVFGKGIVGLLRKVGESNSINEACSELGLSYSKAMRMIKRTEETLSICLLERRKGGSGREGSKLTEEAESLLVLFDEFEAANREAAVENSKPFLEKLEQIRKNRSK